MASTLVEGEINDRIDAAHSEEDASIPYLPPMMPTGTRAATVRVDPTQRSTRTAAGRPLA